MNDDAVAIDDMGVHHAVAFYFQGEYPLRRPELEQSEIDLDLPFPVFGREHRHAGSDPAEQGYGRRGPFSGRQADTVGLPSLARDQTAPFQGRQMAVHPVRGADAELRAELAHGRRNSVFVDGGPDEFVDFLLTFGDSSGHDNSFIFLIVLP